jgi:hypothetical protein
MAEENASLVDAVALTFDILRLSESTLNGEAIYRRKSIFSTLFNALLDVAGIEDVSFTYASMGRENQAIIDALKMNSERIGRFFEILNLHSPLCALRRRILPRFG